MTHYQKPYLNILFHPLGAILKLMNKFITTVLVLQPQLKQNLLHPLTSTHFTELELKLHQETNLDLLNVFVVKIVLLQSLQFIICIIFQSFHNLDLKMTKMRNFF